MPVYVIDTLKPKNGLDFPVVEAVDVAVEGYSSLADAVTHFVTDAAIAALTAAIDAKADITTTDSLQAQIDQIAQAAGTGTADTEIAQARVDADGTTHTTLKHRIDKDSNEIKENSFYINELNSNFESKNIYNPDNPQHTFVTGTITSQGAMTTTEGGLRTGFIKVSPSSAIAFSYTRTGSYDRTYCAAYDSNKVFIERTSLAATFTTQSNAAYIAIFFSSVSSDFSLSNVQLEYGTSATLYQPYHLIVKPDALSLKTLTFTGASQGSYDGTSDVEISIPDYSEQIENLESDKWDASYQIDVDSTDSGEQKLFYPYVVNESEKIKISLTLDDVSLITTGIKIYLAKTNYAAGETYQIASYERVSSGFSVTFEATSEINAKYIYIRLYGVSAEYEQRVTLNVQKNIVSKITTEQIALQQEIDDINLAISDDTIKNLFDSKNIYDANNDDEKFVQGTISSAGAMTTNASGVRTGYIPVEPSSKVVFSAVHTGTRDRIYVALYTNEKAFISRATYSAAVSVPANAGYIAFYVSAVSEDYTISNVQIEYGSTPTPYAPYKLMLNKDNYALYNELSQYIYAGDKADEVEWINGSYVRRINTNQLTENVEYAHAVIEAQKGDIIILDYGENNVPNTIADICIPQMETSGFIVLTNAIDAHKRKWVSDVDGIVYISIRPRYFSKLSWIRMPVNAETIDIIENKYIRYSNQSIESTLAILKKNPTQSAAQKNKPISLLHYSDVHGNVRCIQNIESFRSKYKLRIDDVIVTGDISPSRYSDYIPIYEKEGYNRHLLCIGNHDVYDHNGDAESHGVSYDNREYWATANEKYNQYFKDSVDMWGVVQPENAEENGLCYYYKDYSTSTDADSTTVAAVRLIVLDAMAYDAEQHSWLVSVLNDARTNNKAVVIADHYIPLETDDTSDYNGFNTSFDSLMSGMELWYGLSFLGYTDSEIRYTAANAVDDFIDAGGEFICWICGHMHYAKTGTLVHHPNQIYVAIETASTNPVWNDVPRQINTETEDLFNIISFDTYYKLIKVYRVGAKYDDHMRHRGTMCINYAAKQLIASE